MTLDSMLKGLEEEQLLGVKTSVVFGVDHLCLLCCNPPNLFFI